MAMRLPAKPFTQHTHQLTSSSAKLVGVVERYASSTHGKWILLGAPSSCRRPKRPMSRHFALAPPLSPPLWSIDSDCENVMPRLRETEKLKDCFGAPLTPNEQRSLVRCLDSASLGVDTCLVNGLGELRDHLMSYIEAVSTSQSDDLELVEGAMLLIEQLSLALGTNSASSSSSPSPDGTPGPSNSTGERFSGQWQVLVTTGGGWPYGRLQYVPIFEVLEISEDGRHFRLECKAGPLYTSASGDVLWRSEVHNHLSYHATDFRVELLGATMTLPAPAPDNDLRIFALAPTGTIALARSALGGMQLMGKPM